MSCLAVQDKVGGNASEGATAAHMQAVSASKGAGQLYITDMGPPARKTASLAKILKSRAPVKFRRLPVAHLPQPLPSPSDSRAGAHCAEAGPSGAVSDAAAAPADQKQAASPSARQVLCDIAHYLHACHLVGCPAELLSTVYGTDDTQGRRLHCEILRDCRLARSQVCLAHAVTPHINLACISMICAGVPWVATKFALNCLESA